MVLKMAKIKNSEPLLSMCYTSGLNYNGFTRNRTSTFDSSKDKGTISRRKKHTDNGGQKRINVRHSKRDEKARSFIKGNPTEKRTVAIKETPDVATCTISDKSPPKPQLTQRFVLPEESPKLPRGSLLQDLRRGSDSGVHTNYLVEYRKRLRQLSV